MLSLRKFVVVCIEMSENANCLMWNQIVNNAVIFYSTIILSLYLSIGLFNIIACIDVDIQFNPAIGYG